MHTFYQNFIGTADEWANENPRLYKGVVGIEMEADGSYFIKIGDGIHAWGQLPYLTPENIKGLPAAMQEVIEAAVQAAAVRAAEVVGEAVAVEAADREAADDALQENINAEATARAEADQAEAEARDSGDQAEAAARGSAIDAEAQRATAAEAALDAAKISKAVAGTPGTLMQSVTIKEDTPTSLIVTGWSVRVDEPDDPIPTDVALPMASAEQAGVMPAESFSQIGENTTRIAALEGRSVHYPITLASDSPSQADLQTAYETASGKTGEASDQTTLDDTAFGKSYTWYESSETWVDRGSSSVSQFTNTGMGIIKGANSDGKVFAEEDGTGSVVGWDALKTRTTNLETGKVNTSDVSAAPEAAKVPKYDEEGRLKSGATPAADNDVVRKTDLDDFWAVLYDESKARNLLDVLGIRAVHSDDPATAEEIASAMTILHQKINPDGIPNFSGLRLGDYLDLPTLNDGTTIYTWVGSYKNLRITIAGFNIYKHSGNIENTKNHIVFMFRNCPLTRRMNASNTNTGGYDATEMKTYLDGVFKTGLENVLGNYLYTTRRLLSIKEDWAWESDTVFLPTEREIWGTSVWDEKDWGGGFQTQWPIFRDSAIWKVKRYNGARQTYWISSPVLRDLIWDISYFFCTVDFSGNSNPSEFASNAIGVAPAFCVV
jgi:hypothetical protein